MNPFALIFAALMFLSLSASAQTVGLSGMLGGKALLMVDGSPPKIVGVGETYKTVTVVSTEGDTAVVEISGKRQLMRVGDVPAKVGSGSNGHASGTKVVLSAGSGGHFVTQGRINGHSVPLVVDTGASMVSLSVAEADRIGLGYKTGQVIRMSTANGVIPGWRLQLASVQLGDVVVYGVDAVVSSGSMPYVLLGNSFLTRFQMTRTNDQMVLDKRY